MSSTQVDIVVDANINADHTTMVDNENTNVDQISVVVDTDTIGGHTTMFDDENPNADQTIDIDSPIQTESEAQLPVSTDVVDLSECPLCFEENKTLVVMNCPKTHIFCKDCIEKYFTSLYANNQSLLCPLCRVELLSNTSIEYITVRQALVRAVQQKMMAANISEITRGAQNHRMIRHRNVRIASDVRWEKTAMLIVIITILIAFMIIVIVLTRQM